MYVTNHLQFFSIYYIVFVLYLQICLLIFIATALPGYAILSFVLGIAMIVMAVISFFGYRHYKLEAEIYSMAWKVSWNDVIPTNQNNKTRGSLYSIAKRGSQIVSLKKSC